MRRGFTLLEVVVALLLLEVAVVGAVGTLAIAARQLAEAEHLERAVAEAEGVLDSLAGAAVAASGTRPTALGELAWIVGSDGRVVLRATGADGGLRFEIASAVIP